MGLVIDKVLVEMEAKLSGYNASINNARSNFTKQMSGIRSDASLSEKVVGKSFGLMKTAALGFIASVLAVDFSRVIGEALEYAASLGETAQQLGVTTEALQVYRYAGSQVGVATEQMDGALAKLTRTAGEAAQGAKTQASAFNALGVTVVGANGHIKDTDTLMRQVADGLSKIEDPAKRAAIEVDLFGRAGQKLDTLLSGGSKAIDALRDAAHRLGIVLSDKQIQSADETADKLAALKMVLEARIAGAVADNAQAIFQLANALAEIVTWAAKAAQAYEMFQLRVQHAMAATREAFAFTEKARGEGTAHKIWTEGKIDANRMASKFGSVQDFLATSGPKPVGGGGGGNNPIAGGGGGGKKDNSAEEAARKAREAAEALRRFTDTMARSEAELATANAELISNREQQIDAQLLQIETERQIANRAVEADEDLNKAQKSKLIALNDQIAELHSDVANQREGERIRAEEAQIASDSLNLQIELAKMHADLAETTSERKAAELRLLELQQEEERARLQAILDSGFTSKAEKAYANARLASIAAIERGQREQLNRQFESPGQVYMRGIRKQADEMNDAIESVAVSGLEKLNDELTQSIAGFFKLGGVAGSVLDDILSGLIRIALQQLLIKPLGEALFGGGGGGGGLLGSIFGIGAKTLGGRAAGGHVVGGGMYMVGENGPEQFRAPMSGRIDPANARSSGGGENHYYQSTVQVKVSAPGANAQTVELIRATMAQAAPTLVGAAQRATMRSISRRRI